MRDSTFAQKYELNHNKDGTQDRMLNQNCSPHSQKGGQKVPNSKVVLPFVMLKTDSRFSI